MVSVIQVSNDVELRKTYLLFYEAHAFCDALGQKMPDVLRQVPSREALTEAQRTVHLLVERAAVWVRSLSKLTDYTDFQAQSSGCRALLELAVDVTLVTSEPALVERMWAWEESAKLQACLRYSAYVLRSNSENPNLVKLGFAERNEATVKSLRKKHWGSDRHPPTWFGRPFEQVTVEADRRAMACGRPSRAWASYEEMYAKCYDELCWGTHGSSLSMIRRAEPLDLLAIATRALGESSRLGLELTERAATFLGFDGRAIYNEVFRSMCDLRG